MSEMEIGLHGVVTIEARNLSGNGCDWLQITVNAAGENTELNLFFRGPIASEATRIYAEAVAEANKKIEALQLPIEAPSIVAEKCRDVVEQQS